MRDYFLDMQPEQEPTDYFCDVTQNGRTNSTAKDTGKQEKASRLLRKHRTLWDLLSAKSNSTFNDSHITYNKHLNDAFSPKKQALSREQKQDRFLLYKILPFLRRKEDFGTWIFRHKYSVSITMGIYIISLLVFFSMKIDLTAPDFSSALLIEFPQEEPPKPIEQEKEELTEEDEKPVPLEDIKNQASNVNAKETARQNERLSEVLKQEQEIQNKLNASREAYQRGVSEAEAIVSAARKERENEKKTDKEDQPSAKKIKGNVTVEYDLKDRTATQLPVAAYLCNESGRVTIDITVNNNGDVVSASIARSSSKSTCLTEMALSAARSSRFNLSSSAAAKQRGTITYLFIPQ